MPGGITFESPESYVAFAAIKLTGYVAAAAYLNQKYPDNPSNIFLVGLTRTLIGMVFGAVVGILLLTSIQIPFPIFFLGLIPVGILNGGC